MRNGYIFTARTFNALTSGYYCATSPHDSLKCLKQLTMFPRCVIKTWRGMGKANIKELDSAFKKFNLKYPEELKDIDIPRTFIPLTI